MFIFYYEEVVCSNDQWSYWKQLEKIGEMYTYTKTNLYEGGREVLNQNVRKKECILNYGQHSICHIAFQWICCFPKYHRIRYIKATEDEEIETPIGFFVIS